jgi:integrase
MRVKLTQAFIDQIKEEPLPRKRVLYWHEGMKGFGWQIMPSGHVSYCVQYRHGRTSRRYTIKGTLSLKDAVKEAKAVQGRVAKGADVVAEERKERAKATSTFWAVAELYMKREGKKLRSKRERERILTKYLYPAIGKRQIDEVRRGDVVKMLDAIEDEHGATMAHNCLVVARKVFNWYALREDSNEFRSPIVKGMGRIKVKERARKRVLDDRELRACWRAAEAAPGCYGFLVRYLLLSACRLREAARMTRQELGVDGVWTIPAERFKTKVPFELPLSKVAQELLEAVPQIVGKKGAPAWVFTNDGGRAVGGFSKAKAAFDRLMLAELRKEDKRAELRPWVQHDLRRTARTLMSRAGVPRRNAEMALGHVLQGVEGTYDQHEYREEKRSAFEALSAQIARILKPTANVAELAPARLG